MQVAVLGLWHQNSFAGTLAHEHQRFSPLCSLSKDGQMVAFLCRKIGLYPVMGSSSRGGKEARETLETAMARSLSPAITVDGPKGPARQAKSGIIDIARRAQAQVLPMITVADRFWQLGSWDRLRIPKPFARVAVCYGQPFAVPAAAAGEEFESLRTRLDRDLNQLESEAPKVFSTWRENRAYRSGRSLRGKALTAASGG
jgi:lysophospholipid acyltransferase (LPLAT)-like uncharacterized protein